MRARALARVIAYWERDVFANTHQLVDALAIAQGHDTVEEGYLNTSHAPLASINVPAGFVTLPSLLHPEDMYFADMVATPLGFGQVTQSESVSPYTHTSLDDFNRIALDHGPGDQILMVGNATSYAACYFLGLHAGDGHVDGGSNSLHFGTALLEARAHTIPAVMLVGWGSRVRFQPVLGSTYAFNGSRVGQTTYGRVRSVYTLKSQYNYAAVARRVGQLLCPGDHHYGFNKAYRRRCQ